MDALGVGVTGTHDRFIPVTRAHLTETLLQRFAHDDTVRYQYLRIGSLLKGIIHAKYHAQMEVLKQLYDAHDPDKDTVLFRTMTPAEREANEKQLLDQISHIMEKANFDQLPVDQVVSSSKHRQFDEGIKVLVNVSRFKMLRIWVRGELETTVMKAWSHSLWDKFQEIRG